MTHDKIAIYGGTFDPIHKAHQHVVEEVLAKTAYTHILCVPVAQNPLKITHAIASDTDRLHMLALLYGNSKNVTVSNIELQRGGVSYTIDTVVHIREKLNISNRIGLIIGSDVSKDISHWVHLDRLKQFVELLIVPRPHYRINQGTQKELSMFEYSILDNVTPLDIEAHILRNNPALLCEAVDEKVWQYIASKGLYNVQ